MLLNQQVISTLFTTIDGKCAISTSVISICRVFHIGKYKDLSNTGPYSYKVEAESQPIFIYPADELDLAVERFVWLHGKHNAEDYDPVIHEPFLFEE